MEDQRAAVALGFPLSCSSAWQEDHFNPRCEDIDRTHGAKAWAPKVNE